jgi:hypothetical protein
MSTDYKADLRIENRKQDWWDVSFNIKLKSEHKHEKKVHLKQHKMSSGVFQSSNREYIYLNAILFKEDEDEATFTSNGGIYLGEELNEVIDSAQEIRSFPFIEKVFTVKVETKEVDKKTVYFIKDKSQLEEVWKHYKHPESKRILIERL